MRAVRATLALLVIAMAGCGGGGGGGSTSLPYSGTTTPTPGPPTATPIPAPTPTAVASASSVTAAGYLAGSAPNFNGTTSAGATTVTVAAISEVLIPRPTTPGLVAASVRVAVGGTAQAVQRGPATLPNALPFAGPRVSLSAERNVDAAGLSSMLGSLRRAPASRIQAATSAPASARTFAILTGGIGTSSNAYAQVPATLQQTTTHGYVYVDSSLGIPSSAVSAIANDFENAYASDTIHFGTADYPDNAPNGPLNGTGTPCDANGIRIAGAAPIPVVIPDADQHTAVVVVSQNNAGNGEGGYFDPANYFVQSYANCSKKLSNGVPMIVLVWPNQANATFETQEDMVRVTAHEFQHLINFVSHCILAPVCSGTGSDDPWLNEGLSMLAQDFAVHQMYPNVAYDVDEALSYAGLFLKSPQNFDIGSFAGIDAGATIPAFNCNGCYGGAYLLARYAYNRFGGDAFLHAMETSTGTSRTNLIAVTGQDYGPILGDFSIALASAQNAIPSTAAFTFALNPNGTFVDQFGAPVTLPGIGMAGTSERGSNTTYSSCQGCFFYVGIPTNGTATSLIVTDVSPQSASLAAGLVQR